MMDTRLLDAIIKALRQATSTLREAELYLQQRRNRF